MTSCFIDTVLVLWYTLGAWRFLSRVARAVCTSCARDGTKNDTEVWQMRTLIPRLPATYPILSRISDRKDVRGDQREQRNFETVTERQLVCMRAAWMQNSFWNNLFQGAMVNVFEIGIVAAVIVLWGMGVADAGLVLLVVVYVLRSFNII